MFGWVLRVVWCDWQSLGCWLDGVCGVGLCCALWGCVVFVSCVGGCVCDLVLRLGRSFAWEEGGGLADVAVCGWCMGVGGAGVSCVCVFDFISDDLVVSGCFSFTVI